MMMQLKNKILLNFSVLLYTLTQPSVSAACSVQFKNNGVKTDPVIYVFKYILCKKKCIL